MDNGEPAVPSTPDPELVTLVAALIRHLLTIAGTAGAVHGVYSDSMVQLVAGGVVGVGAVCWSIYQKYASKKRDHQASVMSADRGVAVQPVK